jgi:hypothetical protein
LNIRNNGVERMEFVEMKEEAGNYKESETIKFEEKGQEFIGEYIGFFEGEGNYGAYIGYKFCDVDDPELEFTIFGDSVLKTKMSKVELNQIVKIIYKGKVKSEKTGRMYKDYKFFLAQKE